MKKNIVTLIVAIVCIMSVVAFTACNLEWKEMDGSEHYDSTEKERSIELVNELFEEMLKHPDFVVTCTNQDGELQYTETVKGTDSYTLMSDGSEVYAFKKNGHFYVAFINGAQRSYYCSDSTKSGYYAGNEANAMEAMYREHYCSFMSDTFGAGIVGTLSEEDEIFHCTKNLERVSGFATSTLDFTYTATNRTVTITASSEEQEVQSLRVAINDATQGGRNSDLTWTFTYGGATIALPDVDAFAD